MITSGRGNWQIFVMADICDYLGSLVKYLHTNEHVMYILINVHRVGDGCWGVELIFFAHSKFLC